MRITPPVRVEAEADLSVGCTGAVLFEGFHDG